MGAHNTKIKALMAEDKGRGTKIPKNAGVIMHRFLGDYGIEPDGKWYEAFYRKVIMKGDAWPMTIPMAYVMDEYVAALRRGQVVPESNDPDDHREAFQEWVFERVGRKTRRELMFDKYEGRIDEIGEEEEGRSAGHYFKSDAEKQTPTQNTIGVPDAGEVQQPGVIRNNQ